MIKRKSVAGVGGCLHVAVCVRNTHGSNHVLELKGTVFKMSYSEPRNYSNYQGQFYQGSRARHVSTEQRVWAVVRNALLINGCKGTFLIPWSQNERKLIP